jgi:hypothetical protein
LPPNWNASLPQANATRRYAGDDSKRPPSP